MRKLVNTLLGSLPSLVNVALFLGFVFVLFGILGLQQFNEVVFARCRTTERPVNATYWPELEGVTRVCSTGGGGDFTCPEGSFCGNPIEYGIDLLDDGIRSDAAIQYGISSFSDFGQALLAVF